MIFVPDYSVKKLPKTRWTSAPIHTRARFCGICGSHALVTSSESDKYQHLALSLRLQVCVLVAMISQLSTYVPAQAEHARMCARGCVCPDQAPITLIKTL